MQKIILTIKTLVLIGTFLAVFAPVASMAQDGQLSTHILDINAGKPVANVQIVLFAYDEQKQVWELLSSHRTDANGRVAGLLTAEDNRGTYKLKFEIEKYFNELKQPSIYPYIEVVFKINGNGHYHIPLTLSGNGYSTYRGN